MKNTLLKSVVTLFVLIMVVGSTPLWADDLQNGKALLDRAIVGLFNETQTHSAIQEDLDRSFEYFAQLQDACEKDYWQAQVSYLYGFVEQGVGRSEEAEQRFIQGFELAERALGCGEFSDGYRLMADLQAQLLMYNGMLYAMQHGPAVREYAEKALELDPQNVKAQLNLALFYKNAPAIAGGSEKKAREILHQIEQGGGLEPIDRFSVNVWLGISYAESNDPRIARQYIDQAQEIFPGNTWLEEIKSEHSL